MQYLRELQERLENSGIPAVIQGENTARMIIPFLLLQPTLWVYLDAQFEDAVKLSMDPNHVVTTGIDIEEFYKEQPTEIEQRNELNEALIHLGLFSLLIIAGMFLIVKVLNAI